MNPDKPAIVGTLAAAAAIMLGVAGCSGGSGTGSTAGSTSAAPTASASDINPQPREKLRDGGTFTWPLSSMPVNFNYYQLDGTEYDTWNVLMAILPTAFDNDATAAPVWDHALLASDPILQTEPQQVVTYEINPQAVWSDGTPITWQDFRWQWLASSGQNKDYIVSSTTGYSSVGKVERGKDDRQVIVTFNTPFTDWQSLFSPLYPASTNKEPKAFNTGWKDGPVLAAGPFRLDHIDRTAQTITLVRNERWWGEKAKLDRVVFRVIDPTAQVDALANGEIDAMDIGSDANQYLRARGIAGVQVRVAGGPNFRHLDMNGTNPVLSDVRVRQALAMAIDRGAIARALLGPLDLPPVPLNNHIFMSNQEGYRDNSGETGTYDPARSAALLDEAGWKLDGATRRKDGKPLTVNAVIPAGVAAARQEMELVQNMLGQVGAKLEIQTAPSNDFFDKYIIPGQFDLTVFSWMGTAYPMTSSKSLYAKPKPDSNGHLVVLQNYARIGTEQIDQLFDQASQQLDRARAEQIMNEADRLIWDEVHSLTLYQRPELIACKEDLANFGAFGFIGPWRYEDIGWLADQP
jgi:peptide/nickel transport system substrate-binding protein